MDYGGWINVETGYTWREGAPADQWPVNVDVGIPVNWRDLKIKGTVNFVRSLGNDSERTPTDRFGSRSTFNFNDASMGRVAASFLLPFGEQDRWWVEAGYGIWVWGRSARQYEEPFFSVGKSF